MHTIYIPISDNCFIHITIFGLIVLIIALIFCGGLFLHLIIMHFSDGREVQIRVVDKWQSAHEGLNPTRSQKVVIHHCLVHCVYLNSKNPKKVHTLDCQYNSIYNALKVNKTYTVTVKLFHIVKIHDKNQHHKKRK